jgi:flagellar protein FlaG
MLIHKLDNGSPRAAQASAGTVVSGGHAPDQVTPPPAVERDLPAPHEVALAVARANRAMAALSASVQFVIDPDTKITVVRIVDTARNEVLRQVPAQEMLDIARAIDHVQGLLLRIKA